MQCDYFDAGRCRSCSLMGVPYAEQLGALEASVRDTLAAHVGPEAWLATAAGPESRFRNKAKLVVAGPKGAPTFGILDGDGRGVDLRHCGLYEPGLAEAVPVLADLVAGSGLTPYDVPGRTGELKHLLVTHSPDGELMVRFVLRSPGQRARVEELLPRLRAALPGTRVVSVNYLPGHRAVLEGEEEVVLTAEDTLPMRLGAVTLHLRPRSFFQTNTAMAERLYGQAREWTERLRPRTAWDLYCGVGGFALHLAARDVVGVEVAPDAVESARRSAGGLPGAAGRLTFHADDATAWATRQAGPADLVVVNPPRRGIGPELAGWLERSEVPHVVYSSCNSTSLARDLEAMPSLRVREARLVDLFPQTSHHEVIALLSRR